ncbi:HNH endonuclease [Rahnella inusitata]|uniref:HNH endonuclease n=1 Tax=Rahnella inusitata TaxID=58169 RepID=UPI0039BDE88E
MINIQRLQELFIADPNAGCLICRKEFGRRKVGEIIKSSTRKNSYRLLLVDNKCISLHRALWLMCKGGIDNDLVVDHINGDSRDNRINNLRLCTKFENAANRRIHINNKSGLKGVYFDKTGSISKPWRAQIQFNGKKIRLGRHLTAEDAHKAYLKASEEIHGRFCRPD